MIKKFFLFLLVVSIPLVLYSQVTTVTVSGKISAHNESLVGATVKITHIPSGSVWGTFSNKEGFYTIQGLRVGGPYAIEVSFVGFQTQLLSIDNISLGEVCVLNIAMKEDVQILSSVQVVGEKEKQGGATHVGETEISSLPTIHRSIEDIIRLAPQAGNNNSFAGRDGRYNNITVDGASFNNSYGLTSKLTPGGDEAQPISLDAIEEIGVTLAPFDVRQSHFTGANIALVTRSGDNTWKGSTYMFVRPKSLTGNLVGEETVFNANDRNSQLYGVRLGGPILKNKLFFFVGGEYEMQKTPGNEWKPSVDGEAVTAKKISRTSINDLSTIQNFLKNQYGYDAGKFQDFDDLKSKNYKIIARIDWNINKISKLMVRYNEVHSESDQLVNPKSTPIGNLASARNSAAALSFSNSNYSFVDVIRSLTGELNSHFNQSFSNKLLINYTRIRSKRGSQSDLFPFVDILKEGDAYMSFGYEPFSYGTDLINNTFEITDNFSYYTGKHALTAGLSFNYMNYLNNYMMYGLGYYRFDSQEDFLNGENPSVVALTYGYDNDNPLFQLNFGMGSCYLQDEVRLNQRLMLTYGVRLELPFYFNSLKNNPAIDALTFQDGKTMNVGAWPKSKMMTSPRVGFQWEMPVKKIGIKMRGGTGFFTGLLPFVWFNEQPSLSGVVQNTVIQTNGQLPFATDYHTLLASYPNIFPSQATGTVPSTFVEVDKNFKMPQVWRTNLAFDIKLPSDFIITIEGFYSKDIQAVVQKNINEKIPNKTFNGADQRDIWWTEDETADNRIHAQVKYAFLLTNAQKGYQYAVTTQLIKNFSYGISGMVSYTYNMAKNLFDNYGAAAKSRLLSNVSVNSLNNPELSFSGYSVPHCLIGAVTWKIEDVKNLAFSLSLFYQGAAQGRYSLIYANDMNGDGNTADLMYIPKTASEIHFSDKAEMTATEQQEAFWNYVVNNQYLNKNRGSYAERNGYLAPWVHRFDVRILQDLFSKFGTNRRYTLQLSLDVMNIGNLFNSNWGCYQIHGYGSDSHSNIALLKYAGMNDEKEPVYQLNANAISEFQETAKWFKNVSTKSTWGCLLGLRLIF